MRHGRPNAVAENKADDHAYQKLHFLSRQKKGAGRWWARPPDRVFLKGFGGRGVDMLAPFPVAAFKKDISLKI